MSASTSMKLSTRGAATAVVAVAPAACAKAFGEAASLELPTIAAVLASRASTPSFAPFIEELPKSPTPLRRDAVLTPYIPATSLHQYCRACPAPLRSLV